MILVITRRRINRTMREIKEAIENCDTEVLPGEYAELLLKFIPNNDEVSYPTLKYCTIFKSLQLSFT